MSLTALLMMAAAANTSLCDRLAATVRREGATPAALRRAIAADGGLLAPALRGAETIKVSDELDRQIAATFPDDASGGAVSVSRLGPVWQASWTQGTAECSNDVFFTRSAAGSIAKLPAPPAYSDLCWTNTRDLGQVFGQTALVEQQGQDHPYEGNNVVVTPWRDGWEPACGVAIRFDDRFVLTERFCDRASVCAAGTALAPRLATGLARGDDSRRLQALAPPPAAVTKAQAAAFAAASKHVPDMGDDEALPTFGAEAKTEFAAYSYPTSRIMVVLNGTPLLARIGIGGVGWRQMGDYFVTLYRFGGGRPVPVASYVVAQQVVGLRSVAVYAPKPEAADR